MITRVLGAGRFVLSAFLAGMPRIKLFIYRLARSRSCSPR